jgi:hypothetical protein
MAEAYLKNLQENLENSNKRATGNSDIRMVKQKIIHDRKNKKRFV